MIPLSVKFFASGPLVAGTPFLQFHGEAVETMIGRPPSAFERATAHALWTTYAGRMPTSGQPIAFPAVSAATGSGKSIAACALLAFLAKQGQSGAYVVETIEAVEEVRQNLSRIAPGMVAAYSSIHRANAALDKVRDYREQGVEAGAQFTEDEFRAAPIVVTTHDRWKRELTEGAPLGVLKHSSRDRALVVVDEEPELQVTYQRQPEDVSALASVLAVTMQANEARAYGFTTSHHAAGTLQAIHDRMFTIKANAGTPQITSADLVTAADLEHLRAITRDDLSRRLWPDAVALAWHWETLEFLIAAAQGRVFYSKDDGGAFHAYAFRLPVRARHIVLDGTADLNGLYAVGSHVVTVEAEAPDYSALRLHAVRPPKEFVGQMKPGGILRDAYRARPYVEWLHSFVEAQTAPGDSVLIYAKKTLLGFGFHTLPEFDESGGRDRTRTVYRGRVLHWVNFGRGRGLNRWKHCSVYIRCGDFHLKKAVAIASVGSVTGRRFTAGELTRLSSPSARDAAVSLVQESHLAVTNKQDAARTCIRNISDAGACPSARAFMIDCNLVTLTKYRERMFPGAGEYELIGYERSPSETAGAASRIADHLLTTGAPRVSLADLQQRCNVRAKDAARTLGTQVVRDAMQARGWRIVTRKALGLPGKGKLLVREASALAA